MDAQQVFAGRPTALTCFMRRRPQENQQLNKEMRRSHLLQRNRRDKVPQHAEPHRLALFRVELHTSHTPARRRRGKGFAIGRERRDFRDIPRGGKVGVDKIHVRLRGQTAPERMRTQIELVPADLGHFQSRCGEAFYPARKKAKPPYPGRFLAFVEEHLIAHADSQERFVRGQPLRDGVPQATRLQAAHAIAKGADSRQHHGIRFRQSRRIADQFHVGIFTPERIDDTVDITGAVIDQGKHGRI